MTETNYCQSCAMPLTEDMLGTNKDGSKNEDYCVYCYKDGAFTGDMTMEEMIDFCVGPMVEHSENMTEEKAREMMNEVFPKLKRWSK